MNMCIELPPYDVFQLGLATTTPCRFVKSLSTAIRKNDSLRVYHMRSEVESPTRRAQPDEVDLSLFPALSAWLGPDGRIEGKFTYLFYNFAAKGSLH